MNRLTDKQRDELFEAWLSGTYTIYHLGQIYNVSQSTVSNIISKKLKQKQNEHNQHKNT
ncbi:hypothetical protein [Sphingobacterium sp. Ag1]|uniref:hypothetical protein n=1 Tax=Sphingobacterium sp. Ag1 TaxID=1643451 RepID=UPI0012E07615|nr:hypothetical protein [Sphingobacterium sp. Ag1]